MKHSKSIFGFYKSPKHRFNLKRIVAMCEAAQKDGVMIQQDLKESSDILAWLLKQ
jgi:hypothetical protein